MEDRILTSTKKVLGIPDNYTAFDADVVMHINSVFSVLSQLGVGPEEGFFIEDDTALWSDYDPGTVQLGLIKTYVYLRVRMLFDPPTTSFLIEAANNQIKEYEWRISSQREGVEWTPPVAS